MATRIKYEYDGPIGISKQVFHIKGKECRVVVHKEDFYFEIVDQDNNALIKGGNTTNWIVLLRQAKRALEKLGFEFGTEKRNRGGLDHVKQDKITGEASQSGS